MINKKSLYADLSLLTAAIIWGFGFVAVAIGLSDGTGPYTILVFRFSIATIILLPFQIKKLAKLPPKVWLKGVLLGLFLFGGFAFQTVGQSMTTTSKTAFLTGANVVIVPFLAWIFIKKPIKKLSIMSAFICLIGIGFLSLNADLSVNPGDILVVICAVLFAGHITTTSILAKDIPVDTLVFLQMATATILSLIFLIGSGEEIVLTGRSIVAISYLGVFSTFIAFYLQTWGQKFSSATKTAIILSTESLFGTILGIIIFSDPVSFRSVIGCVLIFLSIIISETQLSFLKRRKVLKAQI